MKSNNNEIDFAGDVISNLNLNPVVNFNMFTHMVEDGSPASGFQGLTSGGGSNLVYSMISAGINSIGVRRFSTGTTSNSTGSATITNYSGGVFKNNTYTTTLECYLKNETLYNVATIVHRVNIGFTDNTSTFANASFFRYDGAISPNWLCINSSASVQTVIDTGIAVNTTSWIRFKVEINLTESKYYMDDVLVATINTNVISNTIAFSSIVNIAKNTLTTTTPATMLIDWLWVYAKITL